LILSILSILLGGLLLALGVAVEHAGYESDASNAFN